MKYTHLPHLDLVGHYQFITFRTFDSMDGYLKKLSLQNKSNDRKQLDIDRYLDTSCRGAYLQGDVLTTLYDFLKKQDGLWYELIAFSIMPNHVHLLIRPLESLASLMQNIKGSSSRMINGIMGKSGRFWARDYYDKAIRDEKHFSVVYTYIKNNPLKLRDCNITGSRFYGIYEE